MSTPGTADRGDQTAVCVGRTGAHIKPILVLGLGNDLAGDDGIGIRVARRLSGHPDLPQDVEVRMAGADLLRAHEAMRGRDRVFLIDAVLGSDAPGTVVVLDPTDPALADAGGSAHQLSPTAALSLLQAIDPALTRIPMTLLGVAIQKADVSDRLSDALADRLESITAAVLLHLTPSSPT